MQTQHFSGIEIALFPVFVMRTLFLMPFLRIWCRKFLLLIRRMKFFSLH